MLSKDFQSKIITDNYQLLSAICFQGYLSDNRGILLLSECKESVNCSHWLIPIHSSDTNFIGIYVGEGGQAFQKMFRGNWGKLTPVIAGYNPEQLSLVAFHNRRDNQFSVFFLEDSQLNPVNSYRVLKPRLVEFLIERKLLK